MAVVNGESTMIETVFENRFQHLEEMRRMGLHSEILRDTAMIHGGLPLQGAQVMSTDPVSYTHLHRYNNTNVTANTDRVIEALNNK